MELWTGDAIIERPKIEVEVVDVGWSYWPLFSPHHYLLGAGPMAFSTAYVGFVGDEPVVHLGMSAKTSGRGAGGRQTRQRRNRVTREARACRLVVMPEWQGAGIGMRFLNAMCERERLGEGFVGEPVTTQFHTTHPGLMAALKRDPKWERVSQMTFGNNKKRSMESLARSAVDKGDPVLGANRGSGTGFGGHIRGVAGWRYFGAEEQS